MQLQSQLHQQHLGPNQMGPGGYAVHSNEMVPDNHQQGT